MQFQPTRNGQYEAANPSETTKAAVNNVIANGDTSKCALYFMTPEAATGQSWLSKSNIKFLFNDNNNATNSHNFYTDINKLEDLKQYMKGGNENILTAADECHKHMEQNGYAYIKGTLPTTANDARSNTNTCCSTYVHWVICEAGIESMDTNLIHRASKLFTHIQEYGEIITSYSELQPGDIVFMTGDKSGTDLVSGKNGSSYKIGHVQIYAGDGLWYNAGGDTSISRVNPYEQGESYVQGRFQVAVRITQ